MGRGPWLSAYGQLDREDVPPPPPKQHGIFSTHVVSDKGPDTMEPAVDALDRFDVPFEHGLRRGLEQREDPRGVGAVALDDLARVDTVVLRFRHLGPHRLHNLAL